MDNNTIIQGDCRVILKQLPNDFVDCVVTSPPYNVGGNNMCDGKYHGYDDKLSGDEYFNFIDEIIEQLIRITKNYVFFNIQVLSANKQSVFKLIGKYHNKIKELLIWNKEMVAPAIEPGVLNSQFELIIVFSKNNPHKRKFDVSNFKQGRLSNVISGKNNSSNKWSGKHAAAFPEYFVRYFIKNFTNEGEKVLDPFMGTGTTAAVCKQNNRIYYGIDINQEYVDIANKRLNQSVLTSIPPTPKGVGILETFL